MAITISGDTNTISGLAVGGLPDGIVDTDMIAANAVTAPKRGAGAILQVVQATKTDTASSSVASGGTWVPTAPKCSITPSNANNKILVQATINLSVNQDSHGMHLTVLKAGALMFVGDADGVRQRVTTATFHYNQYRSGFLHFNYLDTAGGTSAIEYSLQLSHDSGNTQTMYLNRTVGNDNTDDRPLGASSIVLMEVSA